MAAKPRRGDNPGELVFTALGGIGEIGMNLYLYGLGPEHQRRWLMVDLGITFPGEQEPGVDVVLPDPTFIAERRGDLDGILLTHAHEDHFGAVVDLWPRLQAPIYATPFTAALLRAKLAERPGLDLPIREIALGSRLQIGAFDVELVTVAHSIPEPNAVVIRTPLGLIVHTADWKIDADPITGAPTDEKKLRALGEEGVAVMICDSTNALREGVSPSEQAVGASIAEVIKSAKGRVAVTTFASNIARIRSVADAARAAGRELVIVGRAMHRMIEAAKETGYLPQGFRYHDQDAFSHFDRRQVLALCTGSQGEPRAALARIAAREHPAVSLGAGDLVIFSSRTIPGNEKSVGRLLNGLADQGIQTITDADRLVHVTGHPRRGELKQIYEWCRPQTLIPMHGEPRHLEEHARYGRSLGIPNVVRMRNGDIVRLLPGPPELVDKAPVGRLFRDGSLIVPDEDGPVRLRRKLAFVGLVAVSVVLERNGEIAADPEVALDGIPFETASGMAMEDKVLDAVEGALESIPRARRKDPALVRDAISRAARSAVNEAWGKRPICKVLVTVL